MGLSQEQLNAGIDALAAREPNFARALGNADALRVSTVEQARYMGLDKEYGSIAPGIGWQRRFGPARAYRARCWPWARKWRARCPRG